MAKECFVCGKGNVTGNQISHALNHTKRVWKPNLKRVRILDEANRVQRVLVCTRCLRSDKVRRAQ
ncbi:50S ribosomal protein L28 [Guggenheimella bovis]